MSPSTAMPVVDAPPESATRPESPPGPRTPSPGGLQSRSFVGLLLTQFLVALNDNMFRWLVVPIGKDLAGPEHEALALSVGLASFVLPYLLLAAPAGYLADRFRKRSVIVGCKFAEIIIMALGMAAILAGNIYLMFALVFLMGAQSALFSPAKMGSIPELVRPERITAANGLFGLTTVLAIVLGTVAGNTLYAVTTPVGHAGLPGHHQWWIAAAALIGVAVVGWLVSLMIRPSEAGNPTQRFPWNLPWETFRDLKELCGHQPVLLAALGSAYFWWLGAMAQLNVDLFGKKELWVDQQYVGPLLAMLALGVGLGSALAGIWSARRIELGIVPIGGAGIVLSAVLLAVVPQGTGEPFTGTYAWSCFLLVLLGTSGGLFEVPLQAFLQHRSPAQSRGAIMAAYNFLVFAGMLAVSGLFWLLADRLGLSARHIFFVAGLLTVPVTVWIVGRLPAATVRFLLWLVTRAIYRVRVEGLENLPEQGGFVLTSNHVSFADGVLLGLACPRHIRMLAYADYMNVWWLRWFTRISGIITIEPGKRSVVQSIRAARAALAGGEVVGIFPEGGLTRDGQLQPFQPGFLAVLKDSDAPVVPVHLDGLWGSIFSYHGGRFFWKLPKRWPYPVTIRFGRPIHRPENPEQVRRAVAELGSGTTNHECV